MLMSSQQNPCCQIKILLIVKHSVIEYCLMVSVMQILNISCCLGRLAWEQSRLKPCVAPVGSDYRMQSSNNLAHATEKGLLHVFKRSGTQ
ncbi:hypothetical protein C0J52_03233 [Blattella germanica]|nr:hypothetical protein C0J52_03233 [Blattella germanica]